MVYALLYVSQSNLDGPGGLGAVKDMVAAARLRNASLGVTGALIFAESHFVQVLEGSRAAVDELMRSIERDARHRDVRIVREGAVAARRFSGWSLAYAGPPALLGTLLLPDREQDGEWADRLIATMIRFAAAAEGRTHRPLLPPVSHPLRRP